MNTQLKIILIGLLCLLFSACAKEEIMPVEAFDTQAGKKNIVQNALSDEECDFSPLAYSVQNIGGQIELNLMCPDKNLNWSVQTTIGFGLVPDVVTGYGTSINFNAYVNAEYEVIQSGWITSAGGLTYHTAVTSCFSFAPIGGAVELCDDSEVNGVSLANIPDGGGGAGAITPVITP